MLVEYKYNTQLYSTRENRTRVDYTIWNRDTEDRTFLMTDSVYVSYQPTDEQIAAAVVTRINLILQDVEIIN